MSKLHLSVKDVSNFFVNSDNSFQTLEEYFINFLLLFTMEKELHTQYTPKLNLHY